VTALLNACTTTPGQTESLRRRSSAVMIPTMKAVGSTTLIPCSSAKIAALPTVAITGP
jgi:hypothetical protein